MPRYKLFMNGVYLETLKANSYEEAYKYGDKKYNAIDDDLLEVEEVKEND